MVAGAGEGDVEEAAFLGGGLELLGRHGLVPALGLEAADLQPASPVRVVDDGLRGAGGWS